MIVRDRRRELGMSLRELAEKLGVSHVFLGEVERGTARIPLARIAAFALALRVSQKQLFEARGDCLTCRGTGRAKGAA